jgi:astacin (peptidase family M12A)
MAQLIACSPKSLPRNLLISAANTAVRINPVNHPPVERLMSVMPGFIPKPEHIAVLTTKYWHTDGVRLTVGFLDDAPADLRARILLHMNAWATSAKVSFVQSNSDPQVRIARAADGYWSYLGTDILSIPANQPTMNLQDFTMQTSESEFHRVVRHETGHTMGFPHEHMRKELVDKIDPNKAIQFFGATQGWSPDEVRAQVLTPIEESSLLGTAHADPNSIMCYQIPGSITKDGQPIVGGLDIDKQDYAFAGKIYPKVGKPPAVLTKKTTKKPKAKSKAQRASRAKQRSKSRR